MKHRPPPRGSEERSSSSSRIHHLEAQEFGTHCNHLGAMQASSNNRHAAPGNSNGPSPCQGSHAAREPGEAGDIHIQLGDTPEETGESSGPSQHPRLGAPSRPRGHSHSEGRAPQDGGSDLEEHSSSSFSEFRYLFQWLQKSFPYVMILSTKVLLQHITGISLGIGLLTTFMYANKSIVNQIFLRERRSKLQCAWILLFLTGSSLLLYYTFYSQSLHYSLVLLRPAVDFMNFWEVLWIVGVTDFVLKFLFMGFKCVILLLPSFSMSFKAKGYWYMLLEELCQCYRCLVPVPVWFRYFVGARELNSLLGWSFGVLLALLYLILKLLNFFGHLKNLRRVLWIFYTRPSYGVLASKRQCAEVGNICAICQAEFQKPTLLICQHIFCEECIALWFNRERTCPLCRTTISDHVDKWKDGGTSAHLQVY